MWQLERRAWKHELVDRVERRIDAAPVAFASTMGAADEYRRVRASGTFWHDRETLVQAVTERGAGFWVLTPLSGPAGVVLVNRGFVPTDRRERSSRRAGLVAGPVSIVGLVRRDEPGGAFLRANDPGARRWYSRDVGAIARSSGVGPVASVFIDADATAVPGGWPKGGMTVVRFRDNHLVYALTWFGLAVMSGLAGWRLLRGTR